MKALAALTWGKKIAAAQKALELSPEPQCELLFELVKDRLGGVQLGRLLEGSDAGRLVALRRLAGEASADLVSLVALAQKVAHPKLAKGIGLIRAGDACFIASEYISGVTLFELGQAVTSRGAPLDVAVAVRIVLDALKATRDVTELLAGHAGFHAPRCLYPECVWVADFGETFLSEILVAQQLARISRGTASENSNASAASLDMVSAGMELERLVSAGTLHQSTNLPDELIEILARAIGFDGVSGYDTLEELIADLSRLDQSLLASEQQVSRELRRVMGPILDVRRQKLDMLERVSLRSDGDDATKFFRVVTRTHSDTVRPNAAPEQAAGSVDALLAQLRQPALPQIEAADETTIQFSEPEAGADDTNAELTIPLGYRVSLPEPTDMGEGPTNPILDPLLLNSLGRTTSPNVFGVPLKPLRPIATEPAEEPGIAPPPAKVRRVRPTLGIFLLILGALAGAAVLLSVARARDATHRAPGAGSSPGWWRSYSQKFWH